MNTCRPREVRQHRIGSSTILCDLAVPYEAMVWLCQEESEDLRTLRALLQPGDWFVDVGANIGLWSVSAAEAVGGHRIAAFEPNPATFARLQENARRNPRASEMQLVQCALGACDGEISLHCSDDHNVSSVLPLAGSTRICRVPLRTLDSFLSSWSRVQGIKIDAEGFELAVLQGARALLSRDRPWLIVEFNTELAGTRTLGEWEVHRLLSPLGYRAAPMPRMSKTPHRSAADSLPESWTTQGYCNLFYTHQEPA
jgi:FkbM family methyltransferase